MSSKASPSHAPALHPPVGTLICGGTLELVEVLGIGGYGVVYRAVKTRQSTVKKSYAAKCLIAAGQQTGRQRYIHIREIALHQLASAHPGVVTLHSVVDEGSTTFIIMDYAPDHHLFTQILNRCRYHGEDLLIKDVFLQLLDAVEYCHSLGIYHRDLKPENILCFDDGLRIAITDFGLATTDKVSDEFHTGSTYHMGPECKGESFAPTGNYSPMFSDIWSLGIILLNLVTGLNPWKSATPSDPTFQAYLRDPNGFLPTILPISGEVNEILVRMLDVDWRERSTLREVRHAIEGINNSYSLPIPSNLSTFGSKIAKAELRPTLVINTNISTPRIFDTSNSTTSYSTSSSVMHTAIEDDSYSSMFFLNSPISPGKLVVMPDSAITAVGEDKGMTSPTVWTATSETQASSLSSYPDSSASSSALGEDLHFSRPRTPSPEPDLPWSSFAQVHSLQPERRQVSPSTSSQMTEVLPSSRRNHAFLFSFKHGATPPASHPSTVNNSLSPTGNAGGQGRRRSNTLGRLAIKLFPRSPPLTSPPSSLEASLAATLQHPNATTTTVPTVSSWATARTHVSSLADSAKPTLETTLRHSNPSSTTISSNSSRPTVYSHASSSTYCSDYGLFYTRRAFSLESLPASSFMDALVEDEREDELE